MFTFIKETKTKPKDPFSCPVSEQNAICDL